MPKPLAICIEDAGAEPERQFTQCVASVGREPGLGLDAQGAPVWKAAGACELWVSADDRLVLFRPAGAPEATVWRLGRSTWAPESKPVILRDQDEVTFAGRRWRIHVHGAAEEAHAPQPLFRKAFAPIAAALALGAAACTPADAAHPAQDAGIEVRVAPPKVAMPRERPVAPPAQSDAGVQKLAK